MKNYIHLFKENKEVAVVESLSDTKRIKYDYYIYEEKRDYKLTKYSKAYLYPTDFKKYKASLVTLVKYLKLKCNNLLSVDLYDLSGTGIQISLSLDDNTYQMLKNVNVPIDYDIINKLIEEWNSYEATLSRM